MDIHQQTKGAVRVLMPRGPLCLADADSFKRAAGETAAHNMGRVVIDASAIPFVDSRGLEVLAELGDELGSTGMALKLCGVTETVREVLELTDLASHFEYYEDVGAAVRSFL
jgi:anti-anti-sigma factor